MPLSPEQLAANRANAQKSTGPRTPEGKSKSRLNAFRHGITAQVIVMPPEQMEAYMNFNKDLYHAFSPGNVIEKQLVQTYCDTQWRLNNMRANEISTFALNHEDTAHLIENDNPNVQTALAAVNTLSAKGPELRLVSLYESRLNRVLQTTLKQLQEMQAERKKREELEMHDAARIEKVFKMKGEAYNPADDGFVFATKKFEQFKSRNQHLKEARIAERVGYSRVKFLSAVQNNE